MKNVIEFHYTNNINFTLYENNELSKYMNTYNQFIVDNLDLMKELMKQKYFKVPSTISQSGWGHEKVFFPFSTKLLKVLSTELGKTSLQLHPLKSENYLSLSDETVVTNGKEDKKLKIGECVFIPKNTIHSMYENSKVFEEQDNVLFDSKETIRFYDSLGRQTTPIEEYLKYLLPQYTDNWYFTKNKNYNGENDKLIFIASGKVTILVNSKEITLDEKEELYYINKNVKIVNYTGIIKIMECKYYQMGE